MYYIISLDGSMPFTMIPVPGACCEGVVERPPSLGQTVAELPELFLEGRILGPIDLLPGISVAAPSGP